MPEDWGESGDVVVMCDHDGKRQMKIDCRVGWQGRMYWEDQHGDCYYAWSAVERCTFVPTSESVCKDWTEDPWEDVEYEDGV